MNKLAVAFAVLLAAVAVTNGIVVPEGFELPSPCATMRCPPGYVCMESPNPSPFCVMTPCQNLAKCHRRLAVQPPM